MAGSGTLRDIGNVAVWGVATARAGGDTIDTNGFNVTIDQDTRYGLSGTTATSLGSVTINATKGGNFNIDGTKVWLIPYNTGSGTLTAGTGITLSGTTCNTIGLYSAFTVAPVLTGVATGWLKVTNTVGTLPSSGFFTQAGFTFTITGAAIQGFIEIVGDEASTVNANRLGTVNFTGAWFEVGTTSGLSATTYQLPTNGGVQYYPTVWVETGTGTNVYEPYPASGTLVAAASTPTDAIRGKFSWTTTAGVLRFGSDGTNVVGYIPPSGRKIRIPNIITTNCTVAARTANVLPNATLATRYDFTTTGGGVIVMDKVLLNWYPSFAQPYSVNLSYVGIAEQLSVSEIAQPVLWNNIGVGQSAAQAQVALVVGLCFAGGTVSNSAFSRATQATALAIRTLTDVSDFIFSNNYWQSRVLRAAANTMVATDTRVVNCTFTNEVIMGMINIATCTNIVYTNTIYYDCITTTATANPLSVWSLSSNCLKIKLDGLTFGGLTNVQPYTSIVSITSAGCADIKLRNIGTSPSAQLSLGSVNATGLILVLGIGAAATDVKLQKIFTSNTRTGLLTADNSTNKVLLANVMGDYADAADVGVILNLTRKGVGSTLALTAQTAIYGTHWADYFTSVTAGRLAIVMNESTSLTVTQITLTNGAAFTSLGGLYMPSVGMTATFELPYYVLGHSAFTNTALIMAGGTTTNYTYEYAIDKNDGNGFSTITSAAHTAITLGTALSSITGISVSLGFKLKLKVTTNTANTVAITSVYVTTITSAADQANYYPLDINTVTFTGLPTGCDVVVLTAGTTTIVDQKDALVGTFYSYTYSGTPTIDIGFIKPGYVPNYIRNIPLTLVDSSIPVAMTADRNFI